MLTVIAINENVLVRKYRVVTLCYHWVFEFSEEVGYESIGGRGRDFFN